ncbi:MAG: CxxC-x17-CxxC domain-containing protein [bacterium]
MGNFNKGGFSRGGNRGGGRSSDRGGDRGGRSFGGGNSFGGGSSYGGRNEDKQMFRAVCDECGKSCNLPFKPSGGKPVYCSDCFENRGNGNDSRDSGGDSFYKSRFEDKKMFTVTCDSCGERCEVPFRPSGDKPVYCNDCFQNKGGNSDRNQDRSSQDRSPKSDDNKEQFRIINEKLDKILKALDLESKTFRVKKEVKEVKSDIVDLQNDIEQSEIV